jgi:hypothetical protein
MTAYAVTQGLQQAVCPNILSSFVLFHRRICKAGSLAALIENATSN